jgi:hypothetical protein
VRARRGANANFLAQFGLNVARQFSSKFGANGVLPWISSGCP